jgi:aspartyl-tRNA(Asn)/glutamyl-tRNA(Gln) amidotransferase subunit A
MNITQAAAKLRNREVSAVELAQESLRRIREEQPRLNAFITITEEVALQQARQADDELARGIDRGPLHGIPYALKDNFETKGILTTCGSKLFADNIPEHDSGVYEQLQQAGAVLMGKTGLHELAYGITSNNPHYGAIHNPHDVTRIPGGSSGGSGAAVTAGLVFFSMGSDTGGSIRIPAAYCGCVGFKPTFGLVDTRGLIPLSVSFDHAGPLTSTVEDAALVMKIPLTGATPALRIGVPVNFFNEGLAPSVADAYQRALRQAESFGATLVPVTVPDPLETNAIGRLMLLAEASALFQPYLHRRSEIGPDVISLFDQGVEIKATEYVKAQCRRAAIRADWELVWSQADLLFAPTVPIEAPLIGGSNVQGEDVRVLSTKFARPFNVMGFPAISIPLGAAGLPAGLQIVGPPESEVSILATASAFSPPQY